jgi:hypothetical protein
VHFIKCNTSVSRCVLRLKLLNVFWSDSLLCGHTESCHASSVLFHIDTTGSLSYERLDSDVNVRGKWHLSQTCKILKEGIRFLQHMGSFLPDRMLLHSSGLQPTNVILSNTTHQGKKKEHRIQTSSCPATFIQGIFQFGKYLVKCNKNHLYFNGVSINISKLGASAHKLYPCYKDQRVNVPYGEITATCCKNHNKHMNTLCRETAGPFVSYSWLSTLWTVNIVTWRSIAKQQLCKHVTV